MAPPSKWPEAIGEWPRMLRATTFAISSAERYRDVLVAIEDEVIVISASLCGTFALPLYLALSFIGLHNAQPLPPAYRRRSLASAFDCSVLVLLPKYLNQNMKKSVT